MPRPVLALLVLLIVLVTAWGFIRNLLQAVQDGVDQLRPAGRQVFQGFAGLERSLDNPTAFAEQRAKMFALAGRSPESTNIFDEGLRHLIRYTPQRKARHRIVMLKKHPIKVLRALLDEATRQDLRFRISDLKAVGALAYTLDPTVAIEALKKARELDPEDPDTLRWLATLQMRDERNWTESESNWITLLRGAQSIQLEALIGLGSFYTNAGRDLEKALTFLENAFEIAKMNGDKGRALKVAQDFAAVLLEVGKNTEGRSLLEGVIKDAVEPEFAPTKALALASIAKMLFMERDFEGALSYIRSALNIWASLSDNPQAFAESRFLSAACLSHLSQADAAAIEFEEARRNYELAGSPQRALYSIVSSARMNSDCGRPANAATAYKRAIEFAIQIGEPATAESLRAESRGGERSYHAP